MARALGKHVRVIVTKSLNKRRIKLGMTWLEVVYTGIRVQEVADRMAREDKARRESQAVSTVLQPTG